MCVDAILIESYECFNVCYLRHTTDTIFVVGKIYIIIKYLQLKKY